MANEAKMAFAASATTVINRAETITSTYVVGGDTELDNSTNLYPLATATIEVTDTFGAAPTGSIDLFMVRGDTDGTSDDTSLGYAAKQVSDAETSTYNAEYVGSFVPTTDAAYRKTITISLSGVKKAKFYIKNSTGTTLVYSSNPITVKVLPFSYAPA